MEILEVLEQIFTCAEYPTMVCDWFILDFYGKKMGDVLMSEGMQCETKPRKIFNELRIKASSCRRLNSVGNKIKTRTGHDGKVYKYNELKYKDMTTLVASKYIKYFIEKYPDCQFYTSAREVSPIVVRQNNKLVGITMPLIFTF